MLYYVNLCHHVFLNIFDQHHFGPPLARSRWHNLVVEMDKSPLTSTSLGCTSTVGDPENWMNCWELLGTAGNCWEWEQCSAECHETMWKPCETHGFAHGWAWSAHPETRCHLWTKNHSDQGSENGFGYHTSEVFEVTTMHDDTFAILAEIGASSLCSNCFKLAF